MSHIVFKTLVFLFISLVITSLANAFEPQSDEELLEMCPELNLELDNIDESDDQVARAVAMIGSGENFNEAFALLEDAASKGNNWAKYQLGWFYMSGVNEYSDKLKAYDYLSDTKGDYEISAKLLIAVLHAEGTTSIKKDKDTATEMFKSIDAELERQWEELTKLTGPCSRFLKLKEKEIAYQNGVVLSGYTRKLGITLE